MNKKEKKCFHVDLEDMFFPSFLLLFDLSGHNLCWPYESVEQGAPTSRISYPPPVCPASTWGASYKAPLPARAAVTPMLLLLLLQLGPLSRQREKVERWGD